MKVFGFALVVCLLVVTFASSAGERQEERVLNTKSSLFSYYNKIRNYLEQPEKIKSDRNEVKSGGEYVTLVHGNKRKRVWRPNVPYPKFLDPNVTILSTDSLPSNLRWMPTIGNGYIGTVVHSDTVYRSDLFNGYNVTSHRARLQSPCSVSISISDPEVDTKKYSLDMGRGMYIEEYEGDYFHIELKMYAHRIYKGLLITELTVKAEENITVKLTTNPGPISDDLVVLDNETLGFVLAIEAKPKEPEYNSSENDVFVFSSIIPDEITFQPFTTTSYLFMTAIGDSNEGTTYTFLEGEVSYMQGELELIHTKAWEKEWKNGRIDIENNMELARITYASLYYLMSSFLPPDQYILASQWPFIGLSPGDLAHGGKGKDYQGHVFWDQETWMYPPILMLQSRWGKVILNTRIRTLDAAKKNAEKKGYKGAMYPWESAYTGNDVCPGFTYSMYEQHITGDIAFAVKQYFMMTNDTDFIVNGSGGELIHEIASFWESRVSYNEQTGLYQIYNVMPPDEYHVPVNDSAYTNTIAKLSLQMTKDILPLINVSSARFEEIGNKMYIPFNETRRWHPEFDVYKEGEVVKQADVVLLGFPLMVNMSREVRKNDLMIYEQVTPGGPAMTWGMFAIGWLEMGDLNKSQEYFERQLKNVNKPFNVWSELPSEGGAVNFITGMGGYLQSLIFGYGGFRINADGLNFNAVLPQDSTCFNISGLDYLHGSLDFTFRDTQMSITQTKAAKSDLGLLLTSSGERALLTVGQTKSFQRQQASIYAVK